MISSKGMLRVELNIQAAMLFALVIELVTLKFLPPSHLSKAAVQTLFSIPPFSMRLLIVASVRFAALFWIFGNIVLNSIEEASELPSGSLCVIARNSG